jgi:hypothetical protein
LGCTKRKDCDIILPAEEKRRGGDRMRGEEELMTDEQFETYNRLLGLVDKVIERLPDDQKEEIKREKDKILSKKAS